MDKSGVMVSRINGIADRQGVRN